MGHFEEILFLAGPAHIKSNMAAKQGNFVKKTTLPDSSGIKFVPSGKSLTKIGQAMRKKRWRVCTRPRTCA